MHAAELRGVTRRYGRRLALDDVSFAIPPGRSFGLLGPNGAGKTTALRLLLGFARPSSGEVRLRGLPPTRSAARHRVGYLPESAKLPARMRVDRFLRLHARLAGLSGAEIGREVDAGLELTGISDRAKETIGSLSKGLAQRVAFAQAFLGRPELLLLDEPTSGLDPLGMRDAREWLDAARQRGASVLMSSHVLSEVERACDDVAILNEGRIVASGPLEELVEPGETLEDLFVRVVRG